MKKAVVNVMATTGLTLIILALTGVMYGARFLFIKSVFQSLGANMIIHTGLYFIHKFESKYMILESLLDISYAIAVLLVFGFIFQWYGSTPGWMLAVMAVVIYLFGCWVSIFRMKEDVKEINELLQNRNRRIIDKEMNHERNFVSREH